MSDYRPSSVIVPIPENIPIDCTAKGDGRLMHRTNVTYRLGVTDKELINRVALRYGICASQLSRWVTLYVCQQIEDMISATGRETTESSGDTAQPE